MRAVVVMIMLLAAPPSASLGRDGALLGYPIPVASPRPIPRIEPDPRWDIGHVDALVALLALAAAVPVLVIVGFGVQLICLRALGVIAEAHIALAEKRARLAAILPRKDRAAGRLSIAEIEEILAVLPDISETSKTALLQLLQARVEER